MFYNYFTSLATEDKRVFECRLGKGESGEWF